MGKRRLLESKRKTLKQHHGEEEELEKKRNNMITLGHVWKEVKRELKTKFWGKQVPFFALMPKNF